MERPRSLFGALTLMMCVPPMSTTVLASEGAVKQATLRSALGKSLPEKLAKALPGLGDAVRAESTAVEFQSVLDSSLPEESASAVLRLGDAILGESGAVGFHLGRGLGRGMSSNRTLGSTYLNILPYLSYTSYDSDDFYPAPAYLFEIGVDPLYLNTYFAVLNHQTTGITVYHILYEYEGGQSQYFETDVPDWSGEPGDQWCFTLYFSDGAPDIPGSYVYLAIVVPYDGDGYPFNPSALWPLWIYYPE